MPTTTRDGQRERQLADLLGTSIPFDLPVVEHDGHRCTVTLPLDSFDALVVDAELGRDHECNHDHCLDDADLADAKTEGAEQACDHIADVIGDELDLTDEQAEKVGSIIADAKVAA